MVFCTILPVSLYHWHCNSSPWSTHDIPVVADRLQVLGTWSPPCLLWSLGDQRGPASWHNPEPHSCERWNMGPIYFDDLPFLEIIWLWDIVSDFPQLNYQRVATIGNFKSLNPGNTFTLMQKQPQPSCSQLSGSGSRRRSARFWRTCFRHVMLIPSNLLLFHSIGEYNCN